MARCSFCGKELEKGTGMMYVENTGKILYFDSSKCERNMLKLKRKPQKVKWIKKKQEKKSS